MKWELVHANTCKRSADSQPMPPNATSLVGPSTAPSLVTTGAYTRACPWIGRRVIVQHVDPLARASAASVARRTVKKPSLLSGTNSSSTKGKQPASTARSSLAKGKQSAANDFKGRIAEVVSGNLHRQSPSGVRLEIAIVGHPGTLFVGLDEVVDEE